jgi:hypothetical protein
LVRPCTHDYPMHAPDDSPSALGDLLQDRADRPIDRL